MKAHAPLSVRVLELAGSRFVRGNTHHEMNAPKTAHIIAAGGASHIPLFITCMEKWPVP